MQINAFYLCTPDFVSAALLQKIDVTDENFG